MDEGRAGLEAAVGVRDNEVGGGVEMREVEWRELKMR